MPTEMKLLKNTVNTKNRILGKHNKTTINKVQAQDSPAGNSMVSSLSGRDCVFLSLKCPNLMRKIMCIYYFYTAEIERPL